MIKKIKEIKKLGIYDSYQWKCSKEFNRHNICFGFNGSGKSTLSNLFNLVASNKIFTQEQKDELFKDLKTSDNDSSVKFKDDLTYPVRPNQENLRVYVFNSNFIASHVYDGTVGKMTKFNVAETILEDPTIKQINADIDTKTKEKESKEADNKEIEDKFKELKTAYNLVYREHFPNRQLRSGNTIPAITELTSNTKEEIESSIAQKIAEYKLSEKQAELESDISEISKLEFKKIEIDLVELSSLLEQSAKENATDKLKDKIQLYQEEIGEVNSNKIEPWFKLGESLLTISKEKDQSICPLCKTDLSNTIDSLVDEFADYFDKSYLDFIEKIKIQKERIDSTILSLKTTQTNSAAIQAYGIKYNKFIEIKFPELDKVEIETDLKELLTSIIEKQSNSSKKIIIKVEPIQKLIDTYNQNIDKLNSFKNNAVTDLRNQKIDPTKIDGEIRALYTQLIYKELNGTAEENRIENFHTATSAISDIATSISELTDQKIQRLKELKMEAKKVGEYLEKLGITHFTIDLREGEEQNNILIKYKGFDETKKRLRNTLSEGEKTALAFAYFMSKVTTEVTNKGQTIIVIDDPISSLDDNRLYSTAFLIHEEFKDYKQLFVLSHNMLFLKYLNPFFKSKNEKATFLISKGEIDDLPASMENFQSPYFYMLENIINFRDKAEPDYEDARKYLPNFVRRVLETFFSFKYAQLANNRGQTPGLPDFIDSVIDYDSLDDKTIGSISKTTLKNKLASINKVCDNFSHGNMQQLDECNFIPDETLKEIAKDTLDIINFFDGLHLNGINELINPAEAEATA
ncbi:AAA family ATPase [Algoriphagus hitonicola]|uniref:Wobble nucleotide-excising tRNase n=1 Tax=Algoriphagus hitonicola TaxID=435880 RepID=A0A1I2SI19_9BACT|nr:AAA family ATPase [Algoriphagus hitonicola]SFG49846.1 Wobble nucleotide-excising tRNase [Algoriphagus hitonicola]